MENEHLTIDTRPIFIFNQIADENQIAKIGQFQKILEF